MKQSGREAESTSCRHLVLCSTEMKTKTMERLFAHRLNGMFSTSELWLCLRTCVVVTEFFAASFSVRSWKKLLCCCMSRQRGAHSLCLFTRSLASKLNWDFVCYQADFAFHLHKHSKKYPERSSRWNEFRKIKSRFRGCKTIFF